MSGSPAFPVDESTIDPLTHLISFGVSPAGAAAMDISRFTVRKLAHKPLSEWRKEEQHPVVQELAQEIADNKKAAIEAMLKKNPEHPGIKRLEEADKKLDGALGQINSEVKYYEMISEQLMKKGYNLAQPLLKEEDGKNKVENNPVIKDTANQGAINALSLSNAVNQNLNRYGEEYGKEFRTLVGHYNPGQLIAEGALVKLMEKVKASKNKQETLGHIENARGDKLPKSVQEKAREAAGGTRLDRAPMDARPTDGIDPKHVAEQAQAKR